MEKAAIFIDGGYLRTILKKEYDMANVDYQKLSDVICEDLKLNRLRTYFYHCMPIIRKGNKTDKGRYAAMQRFISKLKRLPRFEVKFGKLQMIGDQIKQKMVDVLMSLDIADMSFEGQIQHVILIAGDSDFVPAVRKAKDYGSIVHIYYHPSSIHNELLDEIDELHEISQELIDRCRMS